MWNTVKECISKGLEKLLQSPAPGTMAFVRCLPGRAIQSLCQASPLKVKGWTIYAVAGEGAENSSYITADQAVELREAKQGNILLLVDARLAGAGMDGIYSAVREIREQELFKAASTVALRRLDGPRMEFAKAAPKLARKIGRGHTIAPWEEFLFYARCIADPDLIGRHVAVLGLWPIDISEGLLLEDLHVSTHMVERLLLVQGTASTMHARLDSLLIPPAAHDQKDLLEDFLFRHEGRPWTESARALQDYPKLWLNALKPGFWNKELHEIIIQPWRRGSTSKLYAWSGLKTRPDDNRPVFSVPVGDESSGKLEVRWTTVPEELPPGALSYEVSILTGTDKELASKTIQHMGKAKQRCIFAKCDFEEMLDEGGTWETVVRVCPVGCSPAEDEEGNTPLSVKTEPFILTFSETVESKLTQAVGRESRALVEEAICLSGDNFHEACQSPCVEDKNGFVAFRAGGKSGRVYRPHLIRVIEEDWDVREYSIGRWAVYVREDGSLTAAPLFKQIKETGLTVEEQRKLEEITGQMGRKAKERCGFTGFIHHHNAEATEYVNAWIAALERGTPALALANTVQVMDQTGTTLGLIVLPSHPVRVAWHHMYDELAYHARYKEGLKQTEVVKTLADLDGSDFPAFLPGLAPGSSFLFGDTLGFYAVAMIRDTENEPQAMIALLAKCFDNSPEVVAPSVGCSMADAISREISRYAKFHPEYSILRVHAIRAGDGLAVTRALGRALERNQKGALEDEDGQACVGLQGYRLDLYPSDEIVDTSVVGRHLTETAGHRRTGASGVSREDQWTLDVYHRDGRPAHRLDWSKRRSSEPHEAAHLTLAFDTFGSSVIAVPESEGPSTRPLEAFGLFPSLVRTFSPHPNPVWHTTIAPRVKGEDVQIGGHLSNELHRIQAAVLRKVAENIGHNGTGWPVLKTEFDEKTAEALRRLHSLSDWVVTVGRNTGLEYFDKPQEDGQTVHTYLIDSVAERQVLGSIGLVTSTNKMDEVTHRLSRLLAEMGLSNSPLHCDFLLRQLKAVSGRLALKLSTCCGPVLGELIGLALFYSSCDAAENAHTWLSTRRGFFVPKDDVHDLLLLKASPEVQEGEDQGESQHANAAGADLIYVDISKSADVRFTFVGIKYRRLLRSTKEPAFLQRITDQLANTRTQWMTRYFSDKLTPSQRGIRRRKLAQLLQFYADKAGRYALVSEEHVRISSAIDKFYQTRFDIDVEVADDRTYIFCPEYSQDPREIESDGTSYFYLFGPSSLPSVPRAHSAAENDIPHEEQELLQSMAQTPPVPIPDVSANEWPFDGEHQDESERTKTERDEVPVPGKITQTDDSTREMQPLSSETLLLLGHSETTDSPVKWRVSIRGNPHLMIVGLPGMGKTTSIVNMCAQLFKQGILPIVFSYHSDIETNLEKCIGRMNHVDMVHGIGFNPLKVVSPSPHAWVDNVGMLRDIFSAIYPDLGEIQTNEIREAIKESYVELGYGVPGVDCRDLPAPLFQRFFEIMKRRKKPNQGVMARLGELNDYGFFSQVGERPSLLETQAPTVIRIHRTQNAVLQNALAAFVLLSVYQNMFLRGPQDAVTHAVVFDEAHRAGRLKLIPIMARESRKFGLSFLVSSQAAKDFDPLLYSAIANYLVLRVAEADALALAKNVTDSGAASRLAGRFKQLEKFTAMFFSEGENPVRLSLCTAVS